MKSLNKLHFIVTAVMLIIGSGSALAGGSGSVVYDPMNHAENITTALQTTATLGETVKIAELTQGQYLIDLQNYLPPTDFRFQEQVKQYESLKDFRREVEDLYGKSENAKEIIERRQREFIASGLSWEDYMDREKLFSDEYGERTESMFKAELKALEDVERQHEVVANLAKKVQLAQGDRQLVSYLNEHMNVIATQNSQVVSLIAKEGIRQSIDEAEAKEVTDKAIKKRDLLRKAIIEMRKSVNRVE